MEPIICFGQQPCGFFPKRFFVAKMSTARALQNKIGGKIVFFYHDSDADYRETITIMRDKATNDEVRLNFTQENKLQKKHSPLYAKRIPAGWKDEIAKQLPRFLEKPLIDTFTANVEKTAADFCLEMYKKLGLLEGIKVTRSSDADFRNNSVEINSGFVDYKYQGEIVRAKIEANRLSLHEGGQIYTYLPKPANIPKTQISAGANERFEWMNSVIQATHYIYGEGEKEYLRFDKFPEVNFVEREKIDAPNFAWLPNL